MAAAHRRHDISDQVWEGLRPLLPGAGGKKGRPAKDNRLFLNAVFWILRTVDQRQLVLPVATTIFAGHMW